MFEFLKAKFSFFVCSESTFERRCWTNGKKTICFVFGCVTVCFLYVHYIFFVLLERCSFAYWLAFFILCTAILKWAPKWENEFALLQCDWLAQTSSARRSSDNLRNVRKCVRSIDTVNCKKALCTIDCVPIHTVLRNYVKRHFCFASKR